jgi:hypothetical protein
VKKPVFERDKKEKHDTRRKKENNTVTGITSD